MQSHPDIFHFHMLGIHAAYFPQYFLSKRDGLINDLQAMYCLLSVFTNVESIFIILLSLLYSYSLPNLSISIVLAAILC